MQKKKSGFRGVFLGHWYFLPEGISTKIILAEIIFVVFGMYFLGFYLNKEDPLFLNSKLNFLYNLLPIALITLFYGIFAGLVYFALFTSLAYFTYKTIDHIYFLSLFLFLLVFSEFWFYWKGKLKEAEIEYNYIAQRLKDLTASFSLLKLSHEQLERSYITKPISLKQIILNIRHIIARDGDIYMALRKVFDLILVNYDVEEAILIEKYSNGRYKVIANTSNINDVDLEDPFIRTAIENQKIAYVSDLKESEITKYLAVIPININDEFFYIFVLKRMPFMKLNIENLITINLLLYYVALERLEEAIAFQSSLLNKFDISFLKEVYRLIKLNKEFGIESHIVLFCPKIYEYEKFEILEDVLQENIRGIDMMEVIYLDGIKVIAVLLPFTDRFGAEMFVKRIGSLIVEELSYEFLKEELSISIYHVKQVEDITFCHGTKQAL